MPHQNWLFFLKIAFTCTIYEKRGTVPWICVFIINLKKFVFSVRLSTKPKKTCFNDAALNLHYAPFTTVERERDKVQDKKCHPGIKKILTITIMQAKLHSSDCKFISHVSKKYFVSFLVKQKKERLNIALHKQKYFKAANVNKKHP